VTAQQQCTVESGSGPATAVLAGRGITVRFGGLVALSEVSLDVPERALVGLIGPNGAGKSTLLGVLSGLVRPGQGQVFLGSTEVTSEPAHIRARMGLARTYQQVELFAGMSVQEHLAIAWRCRYDRRRLWRDFLDGRAWRGTSPAESERIDYLLGRLGLEPLRHSLVTSLPLGSSRLVEIGRALAASPRLVLLDEPFSGLNRDESEELAATLGDLVLSEGVSFLLVDHDVDTVLARSEKVVVIDAGRVIATGTPAEIRANEAVQAAYLGDAGVGMGAVDA
jgi:branched-chain amino acid transport system ATP-binding protein